MANHKKGLDYFTHDTDLSSDQNLELVEAEFGLKGYGIYLKLLEKIYGDSGYYMQWNKDIKLLFARRVGESGSLVDEIVNGLLKRGLFNKSVFKSSGVLTSEAIQTRYIHATKRREQVDLNAKYLLIPPNVYNEFDNVNITGQDVNISKQSRVEKSKEEKSRVEYNARAIDSFTGIEHAKLHKLDKPLTENQLRKLRVEYGDEAVRDVLLAMENHKKLIKKYTSAYLTANNWCKRRQDNGNESNAVKNAISAVERQDWDD